MVRMLVERCVHRDYIAGGKDILKTRLGDIIPYLIRFGNRLDVVKLDLHAERLKHTYKMVRDRTVADDSDGLTEQTTVGVG